MVLTPESEPPSLKLALLFKIKFPDLPLKVCEPMLESEKLLPVKFRGGFPLKDIVNTVTYMSRSTGS